MKIAMIMLAAGNSRRFGANKLKADNPIRMGTIEVAITDFVMT